MSKSVQKSTKSPSNLQKQVIRELRQSMKYIDPFEGLYNHCQSMQQQSPIILKALLRSKTGSKSRTQRRQSSRSSQASRRDSSSSNGSKAISSNNHRINPTLSSPSLPPTIMPTISTPFTTSSINSEFKIISHLLQHILNIKQKVELQEEKLRQYFEYWLRICDRELENQIINDAEVLYNQIIIVFEAIDLFKDQQSQEESRVSFWLPRLFPANIRVIITADKPSKAVEYFTPYCQNLKLTSDYDVCQAIIQSQIEKNSILDIQLKEKVIDYLFSMEKDLFVQHEFTRLFSLILLPTIDLPKKSEYAAIIKNTIEDTKLKQITTFPKFLDFILETFSQLFIQSEFISIICILALTRKGFSAEEIMLSGNISQNTWEMFCAVFSPILINYADSWTFYYQELKGLVKKKYMAFIQQNQLEEKITLQLEKSPNSISKLEELSYHLLETNELFKLKESIINMENFLLLFNSNSKFQLTRFWQKLEEAGFDMVLEYNKAIETFQGHYRPNSDDLFSIMIQICRFLREFSDFENFFTPEFRHPPIQGYDEDFHDIGLLSEIDQMQMFHSLSQNKTIDLLNDSSNSDIEPNIQKKLDELRKAKKYKKRRNEDYFPLNKSNDKSNIQKSHSQQSVRQSAQSEEEKEQKVKQPQKKKQQIKRMIVRQQPQEILSSIEKLNVDIPINREAFTQYYFKKLQPLIEQEKIQKKQSQAYEDEEQSKEGSTIEIKRPTSAAQEEEIIRLLKQQEYDNYNQKPSNYYYKRWLWVQFPWLCLSFKSNYSLKMKQCFSIANEYISVKEEQEFNKQAIKYAIEAKIKKKMLISNQNDVEINIKHADSSINMNITSIMSAFPFQNETINRSTSHHSFQQNQNISLEDPYQMPAIILPAGTLPIIRSNSIQRDQKGTNDSSIFLTQDQIINYKGPKLNNKKDNSFVLKETSKFQRLRASQVLDLSSLVKNKKKTQQESSLNILPRLKVQIINQGSMEMNLMIGQKDQLKRQLDQLVYQNSVLQKRLKELQTIQQNQAGHQNSSDIIKLNNLIEALKKELARNDNQLMLSTLEKHRIKIILKICQENHSQNEEWIRVQMQNISNIKNLNYLVTNLCKVTQMEEKQIDKIRADIQSISKTHSQFQEVVIEKKEQQSKLINLINQSMSQKSKLDSIFINANYNIMNEAKVAHKKISNFYINQNKKNEQKKQQADIQKVRQQVEDKLDFYKEQYNRVKVALSLEDDAEIDNEKFLFLILQLERRNILMSEIMDKQQHFELLKNIIIKEQAELKMLRNASHQSRQAMQKLKKKKSSFHDEIDSGISRQEVKLIMSDAQKDFETKQQTLKKLSITNSSCILFFENVKNKLQMPKDTDCFQLREILKAKQQFIQQQLPNEDYQNYQTGKLLLTQIYKKLVSNNGANFAYLQSQSQEP